MKKIYSRFIPPKGFLAINFFGILVVRKGTRELTKEELNHELIHTAQMKELLFIFFYLIYVLEWLFRLIQYRDSMKAYYNISFEKEAYKNDTNLNYLNTRKHFGQWRIK